jgi:hypothetical protein
MFVLCLFDRQSIQSVVCWIALRHRDHPFRRLIEGWHPQKLSSFAAQYV